MAASTTVRRFRFRSGEWPPSVKYRDRRFLAKELPKLVHEDAPPPEMLERCHRNYVQSWWEMGRSLPGARIENWHDGTAMRSSVPSEMANTLFVVRRPDDAKGPAGESPRLLHRAEPLANPGQRAEQGACGRGRRDVHEAQTGGPRYAARTRPQSRPRVRLRSESSTCRTRHSSRTSGRRCRRRRASPCSY